MFRCNPVSEFLSHLGEYSSPQNLLICFYLSYVCFAATILLHCMCLCCGGGVKREHSRTHTAQAWSQRLSSMVNFCVNVTGP